MMRPRLLTRKRIARIGLRRMQHHGHRCTAVHPSTRQLDLTADRGLARPDKSLGHVRRPSIPSSAQDVRSVADIPCPHHRPLRLLPSYARSLRWLRHGSHPRRFVNQTILCCADWGQITVSYTVLPLRRSSTCGLTCRRSRRLAASKKHRQDQPALRFRVDVRRRAGCGRRGARTQPPARRRNSPNFAGGDHVQVAGTRAGSAARPRRTWLARLGTVGAAGRATENPPRRKAIRPGRWLRRRWPPPRPLSRGGLS